MDWLKSVNTGLQKIMCNPEKKEKNTQFEIDVITYSLLLFSLRNFKGKHENKGEKKIFNKMAKNKFYLLFLKDLFFSIF